MLRTVSAASGGGQVPNWLSTHPDPQDRRQRIQAQIDSLEPTPNAIVNRAEYLRLIDGMTYGPNPREGFFRENVFLHPDLEFRLDFPAGWETANSRQAVAAVSPDEDGIVQLTLASGASPESAARAFLSQEGVTTSGTVRSGDVNGLPAATAAFLVTTESAELIGLVTFVLFRGDLYRILGYTLRSRWDAYRGPFQTTIGSFRRLTDSTALGVQPLRLDIVRLDRAMTLREFAERYRSQVELDVLVLLNQLDPDERLASGAQVKRVVGGPVR
jgi:predicted Zn-dependent protease